MSQRRQSQQHRLYRPCVCMGCAHGRVRVEPPLPARDRLAEAKLVHWKELGALYLAPRYVLEEEKGM